MSVSIAIPVFNDLDIVKGCLESLLENTPDELIAEVIIVDDGSDEQTREYLRSLGEPFKVIFNEQNHGYSYNNNLAAAQATGKYFCALNADTILTKGWLQAMLKVFEKEQKVGVVGNVHWDPRSQKPRRYDHMGVYFGKDCLPRHFGWEFRCIPFAKAYNKWDVVIGACMLLERETFINEGGFDEVFQNGAEDLDLCLRLKQRGYQNYVAYRSRIGHYKGTSPGRYDNDLENRRIHLERWADYITSTQTFWQKRHHALNYLGRMFDRPWKLEWKPWLRAWTDILGIESKEVSVHLKAVQEHTKAKK